MKIAPVIRWVGILASLAVLIILLGFAWVWHRIETSLPTLDGTAQIAGLSAEVRLERDEDGSVTIQAASRLDAARALGFAHGQDRFFQMDVTRRRAAGELSALFGDAALPLDRSVVGHRFRALAQAALAMLPPEQVARLEAYAAGVNAGLQSLEKSPWEYAVLRADARPWAPEDCGLVFYAMVLELQDERGRYEQNLNSLRDVMGKRAADFFAPLIGPQDSAFDGSTQALPPLPSERVLDLRGFDLPQLGLLDATEVPPVLGSNAIAVPGDRTGHGAGLIAGDPHLAMQVPNTWYRASLLWSDSSGVPHRVTGVSLPGVPGIIIGSNGHIAWTFTNATVDIGDLVPLDLNQIAPELLYHKGAESLEFEERVDIITLKDGSTEEVPSTWTIYGPIVDRTIKGKPLAFRWVFHDPAALNFDLLDLMEARDVEDAIAIAATSGMPNQNLFVADSSGEAAWTLTGKIPQRFGFDGRFPVEWTFGDRGWDGYISADKRPVIRASADRPLWSGNQRKVSGEDLAVVGDAGYDSPERASQIERGLAALPTVVSPDDLLAIQLDDRGEWLFRWRDLLVTTLRDLGIDRDDSPRGRLLALVEDWDGYATADSVGYRVLREWRDTLSHATLGPIFEKTQRRDLDFSYHRFRYEEALWTLHQAQPEHLLSAHFTTWPELRVHVADVVIAQIEDWNTHTWGEVNRLAMNHPFAHFLPQKIAQILNMPAEPQSGDSRMPRVARPGHGASLRFVVAPGQEETGLMHLPGGQSGNPRSPFYRAGHRAWELGAPTPFLPGDPYHVLILKP
ncbi:MAG: penicillin acylase family protein [Synoicihabitans sp.]